MQRERLWRRTKPFLYIPTLLLNPAFTLGYLAGKQHHWPVKVAVDIAVLIGCLVALTREDAISAISSPKLPGETLLLAEAIIFLVGTAAGEMRARWNKPVEIYYLSMSHGQFSACTLFLSTTYLHMTFILA